MLHRNALLAALGLTAFAVVGCAPPSPAPTFALAPAGATLTVRLLPAGYAPQYLRAWDWDVATARLEGPGGIHEATATAEIDPDTGRRSATLAFSGLMAGTGYRLTLTLSRDVGGTPEPLGTAVREGIALGAGANALTLDRGVVEALPDMPAAEPLLPGFVTSLPGAGMAARLDTPSGVVVAPDGTVYLSDTGNGAIRRVAPDAHGRLMVTMLAGLGYPGFLDGAAETARFNQPRGLALGPEGDVYVADTNNKYVRRIATDADGHVTVSTLRDATGKALVFNQPQAVAVDAAGHVTVAEPTRLVGLTPTGTAGRYAMAGLAGTAAAGLADGQGDAARFGHINALALAGDTLYVADTTNHRLRRVDATGTVTTLDADFPALSSVAVASGVLYVAERTKLYRLDEAGSPVLLAGAGSGFANGGADAARFKDVEAIAVTPDGHLIAADAGNHRAREVVLTPEIEVSTLVGDGERGNMNGPAGEDLALVRATALAVDASDAVVVADVMGQKVVRITADGSVTAIAGDGTGGDVDGPGETARFNGPAGIAVGPTGDYWVTDVGNGSLRRVFRDGDGWRVETVVRDLEFPGGVAVAADGTIYVTEAGHPLFAAFGQHRVLRVRLEASGPVVTPLAGGALGDQIGAGSAARFNRPTSLAILPDGALLIADAENHRLKRLEIGDDGQVTVSNFAGDGTAGLVNGPVATARFNRPSAVAVDAEGRIVVADYWNHAVRVIADGQVSTLTGGHGDAFSDGPASQAQFSRVVGVAVGPDGFVYAVDAYRHGVRRIAP